ncbi:hypothetical protein [Streptomyces sp. KN37]|uniref:hypothetical protein n=1 Tax=Streptomyces sp. KN37 TaxID=3090667 RepID=UPI002A756660|nr:hypothetical protein [Streptomyces sp. KN37]WPO76158.1 hypothetical protein R9806_02390 [Streptomyces sp. KN37]
MGDDSRGGGHGRPDVPDVMVSGGVRGRGFGGAVGLFGVAGLSRVAGVAELSGVATLFKPSTLSGPS